MHFSAKGATIPMLQEALGINTAEYIANARTSAFDYSAEFGKFFLDEGFDDAGLLYNQVRTHRSALYAGTRW